MVEPSLLLVLDKLSDGSRHCTRKHWLSNRLVTDSPTPVRTSTFVPEKRLADKEHNSSIANNRVRKCDGITLYFEGHSLTLRVSDILSSIDKSQVPMSLLCFTHGIVSLDFTKQQYENVMKLGPNRILPYRPVRKCSHPRIRLMTGQFSTLEQYSCATTTPDDANSLGSGELVGVKTLLLSELFVKRRSLKLEEVGVPSKVEVIVAGWDATDLSSIGQRTGEQRNWWVFEPSLCGVSCYHMGPIHTSRLIKVVSLPKDCFKILVIAVNRLPLAILRDRVTRILVALSSSECFRITKADPYHLQLPRSYNNPFRPITCPQLSEEYNVVIIITTTTTTKHPKSIKHCHNIKSSSYSLSSRTKEAMAIECSSHASNYFKTHHRVVLHSINSIKKRGSYSHPSTSAIKLSCSATAGSVRTGLDYQLSPVQTTVRVIHTPKYAAGFPPSRLVECKSENNTDGQGRRKTVSLRRFFSTNSQSALAIWQKSISIFVSNIPMFNKATAIKQCKSSRSTTLGILSDEIEVFTYSHEDGTPEFVKMKKTVIQRSVHTVTTDYLLREREKKHKTNDHSVNNTGVNKSKVSNAVRSNRRSLFTFDRMLRRFEKHIPKINLASKRSHVACSIFRARLIKSDTLMRDSKRHLPSLLDNAFRPIAVAERLARNTTSWLQLPGGGVINYGKLVLKYRFTEANQTTVVKNLEMPSWKTSFLDSPRTVLPFFGAHQEENLHLTYFMHSGYQTEVKEWNQDIFGRVVLGPESIGKADLDSAQVGNMCCELPCPLGHSKMFQDLPRQTSRRCSAISTAQNPLYGKKEKHWTRISLLLELLSGASPLVEPRTSDMRGKYVTTTPTAHVGRICISTSEQAIVFTLERCAGWPDDSNDNPVTVLVVWID
ncbi:hypothetical protein CLF_102504 [Clonorchis sinensis]|uniref:Uncharacterized protein n=1 Tax=Clonorchis sinensis TaxID=79923 RepID=G7YN32_CLOSI|nr:hypothetical protein CLF_102504 [Clonorchis sinensis]